MIISSKLPRLFIGLAIASHRALASTRASSSGVPISRITSLIFFIILTCFHKTFCEWQIPGEMQVRKRRIQRI